MERKFNASFYFKTNNKVNAIERFANMGFEMHGVDPIVMTIYLNLDQSYVDVEFDQGDFENFLSKKPLSVRVMNKQYDPSGENFWFQVKEEANDIVSIQWSVADLSFLLETKCIERLVGDSDFICGYCFDQTDRAMQVITDIDYFKAKLPGEKYKTIKNKFKEDIVDISEHWGRNIFSYGLDFMAAPLMWFGGNFYNIICKEKLLHFPDASLMKVLSGEIVFINLFDLNAIPSDPANRIKQKAFWVFFDLLSVIERYNKENEIDPAKAFEDFFNN